MKTLQVNSVSGIRSTGRTCVEMADCLNAKGHDARIAHVSGPPHENAFRIGNRLEIKAHSQFSKALGLQGYFSHFSTLKLIRRIAEFNPDVVHLRNLHSSYINLRILAEYLAREDIPTVLTLHDCWFFTGGCCYYTRQDCFRWQTGCRGCPLPRGGETGIFPAISGRIYRDKRTLFGRIPRLAVIGVSDWITSAAEKSLLSRAKIVRRIYNWIDTDVFRPVDAARQRKKLGLEGKFVIMGAASRWSGRKGLEKFIGLSKLVPGGTAILLVGGAKSGARFPGNVVRLEETHDAGELARCYSAADVFLQFSADEAFGKVTAESLACGTPVIVNNSTANPELAAPGAGYVMESNEPRSAVPYLLEIMKNGKQSYSDNCVRFAGKAFSMKDRIEDYLKVYRELISYQ